MRVRAHRDPERPREPKVGELEVVVLVDEQVLRLQVPMEYPVRVAVEQARGELVCEFLPGTVSMRGAN